VHFQLSTSGSAAVARSAPPTIAGAVTERFSAEHLIALVVAMSAVQRHDVPDGPATVGTRRP
jgi:hypothetical protein